MKPMHEREHVLRRDERLKAVEAVCQAAGLHGIRARDVVAKLPFRVSLITVNDWIRQLRDQKRIEPTHPTGGHCCRWGPPGTTAHWEPVRREQEARRSRRAMKSEAASFADTWLRSPPTRIIRPAAECKPPRAMGPRSVFDLGAA